MSASLPGDLSIYAFSSLVCLSAFLSADPFCLSTNTSVWLEAKFIFSYVCLHARLLSAVCCHAFMAAFLLIFRHATCSLIFHYELSVWLSLCLPFFTFVCLNVAPSLPVLLQPVFLYFCLPLLKIALSLPGSISDCLYGALSLPVFTSACLYGVLGLQAFTSAFKLTVFTSASLYVTISLPVFTSACLYVALSLSVFTSAHLLAIYLCLSLRNFQPSSLYFCLSFSSQLVSLYFCLSLRSSEPPSIGFLLSFSSQPFSFYFCLSLRSSQLASPPN